MDYYLDIIVKPGLEYSDNTIMNHLYASLHKTLFDYGNKKIGCSFPQVANLGLGSCLRLHGSQTALEDLMAVKWLKKFEDYVQLKPLAKVPEKVAYRVVRRVQVKSSPERLLRRSIKKGKLSLEEAEQRLQSMHAKTTKLPYLRVKSTSTGQYFRLFVIHDEIMQKPAEGEFNHYGFSQTATIPWF